MPYHRFKIDQTVMSSTPALSSGRYTILRLLPFVHGEPHYWVKSLADGNESSVSEGQVVPLKGNSLARPPRTDAKPFANA